MTKQALITTVVVLCSLGGWYVIIHKYLELKAMLKNNNKSPSKKAGPEAPPVVEPLTNTAEYLSMGLGRHVPGMGPPPLSAASLEISEDLLSSMQQKIQDTSSSFKQPSLSSSIQSTSSNPDKGAICSWATIMHLSGFSIVTGIMFINVIVPTILWLLKKDEHPYLAKQGREVINFHITLTFIQIFCLAFGSFFIWLLPEAANTLFAWTRTVRIVFATSMYLPFNLFTAVPFIWACVLIIRGSVASYHGLAFKYPYAQPFIIETKSADLSQKLIKRKEPSMGTPPSNKIVTNKINFG